MHALGKLNFSPNPLQQNIGRLIGVVGTNGFESSLFEAAHAATGCSHLTAFASSPASPPATLIAMNAGSRQVARLVADKYTRSYWQLDPANSPGHFDDLPAAGVALRIRATDIGSARYRRECYTGVDLGDRFSLLQRARNRLYRINFYCSGNRFFDDSAIQNILDSADLLIALITRHQASSAADAPPDHDALIERLRLYQPAMTRREFQVCAGIARGLTSEGIALEHGIAINTVLTYRKRAYARLGISSQNELLRLVLALPASGRSAAG